MRALVPAGNSGVWGGVFSTYDCAIKGIRQKVDAWNAIRASFMAGGSLAIRGGYCAARTRAVRCAPLYVVIEGVGIGLTAGTTKLEVGSSPTS
ncbi:Mitochondrial import inner membrane translocase subunit tim17 [Colletotrichum aenigma]|uniref:Mitochondrial import inner membrane translocase subunit tim17 n=1 Tax=Colletotrichum aenigma TaxID=1215731 RepID=UPI001872DA1A|nr:Mitochondrial import inner membrane translocase subunit tim17 [Colletotrichum aenigma]KAF5502609.1 Mitochondrial import inner membrane translocase subunit tim17 [Colletotrichum aenigma]